MEAFNVSMATASVTFIILFVFFILPKLIMDKTMQYFYDNRLANQNYCYEWMEFFGHIKRAYLIWRGREIK